MISQLSIQTIRPDHLERRAFIYVRQSTPTQVLNNTASTARQYDLVQRALDLGWDQENIVVIDQDQGCSGASAVGRDGFQSLVAEVGLGHAGAVLSLEASRLARSSSDWHRLLEICALADTLVVDEEGIYDPSQFNDRLLLGFKGTMSEAELHWLRQRLFGGKIEKASQGKLRFRLPAGYVHTAAGQIVLDPDEQVQEAVHLVFDLFTELGTAFAVVKHFRTHKLLFPQRYWGSDRDGELVWTPLRHGRVMSILHNPTYAGVYAYGRTKTRRKLLPGEAPRIKGRTQRVQPADWPIAIQDAHPAYIIWEQFLHNQQQLDDNRSDRSEDRRGAVREGAALLQGIALCGKCGRRMSIRYRTLKTGTVPSYECGHARNQYAGRSCQSIRGDGIDAAVAQAVIDAMQPAQLEVSLATLEQVESRARQIDQQWKMRLERAQYQADLARRRFMAVDPDNRLVARNLERDWNDKLLEIQQLEREYATRPNPIVHLTSPAERQNILSLAQDFPRLWQAETTMHTERKQLLRFLVKDITLTKQATTIHIGLRWQTEALTELEIPRPQKRADIVRTKPAVVERIQALAATHTDQQTAEILNQAGFSTGIGEPFTASKIYWIRYANQITTNCPEAPGACPTGQRGDGRYSTKAVAELLNVDVSTVSNWCEAGRLDCIRANPRGPRWIKLTPDIIQKLRKPIRQHRS
jgi:DNA invertase Pin-like site-specific DNA recombinase